MQEQATRVINLPTWPFKMRPPCLQFHTHDKAPEGTKRKSKFRDKNPQNISNKLKLFDKISLPDQEIKQDFHEIEFSEREKIAYTGSNVKNHSKFFSQLVKSYFSSPFTVFPFQRIEARIHFSLQLLSAAGNIYNI